MSCNHLVPARNVQAFFSTAQSTLTVSAEVTLGPGNYGSEICRNIIDPLFAQTPSFVVGAPPPSGIQPDYAVVKTISASFPCDKPPMKIFVYAAGIDGPERTEVAVSDAPLGGPQRAVTPAPTGPAPGKAAAPRSVTGWSRSFDYDDALADALRQLQALFGSIHPDIGVNATVVETGVALGGFRAKTGLYIKLQTV
jgi:hypothetical protein